MKDKDIEKIIELSEKVCKSEIITMILKYKLSILEDKELFTYEQKRTTSILIDTIINDIKGMD